MITNENKHKKGIKNYNCDEDKKHIKEYNNASWNFLEKNKEIHREMTQRIGNEERNKLVNKKFQKRIKKIITRESWEVETGGQCPKNVPSSL